MERRATLLLGCVVAALGAGVCVAQHTPAPKPGGYRGPGLDESGSSLVLTEGSGVVDENTVRTARETASHSTGTPNWTNPPGFEKDVFTFTRIIFKSGSTAAMRLGFGRALGWWVDYPDADLNFSYRLQQMTSTKVDPDARVLKLSDPALYDYPFIFMEHVGYMQLRDDEVSALRTYLLNGGAVMINDFWSQEEWDGFAAQMKRVLPGKEWVELGMDHPVFHSVFDIRGTMQSLQVPTIQFWNPDFNPRDPESRLQTMWRGEGSEDMHVRALLDDKQRIMVLAVHNSDVPDGWEREGENAEYFHRFSEKIAYPLGINMIFYLMTH